MADCAEEITDSSVQEQKTPDFDLEQFKFERILSNNAARKVVMVLGQINSISAIIILEKLSFAAEEFSSDNAEKNIIRNSLLELVFKNDIYGNFNCFTDTKLNKIKATTIYPATEKHITKYSEQELFVIDETPELYEKVTLPYISSEQFTLDWVYNILEHKQEQDRIVIEDLDEEIGFVLLPDLKWDGSTKETLYVTAIVMRRDIKSIRDLSDKHLPLLMNIKKKCLQAIEDKYGISSHSIRSYFHYQPSFYHLHIHFNYIKYDAPGIGCGKAHLLESVIRNIMMIPNYYQKATLTFVARENDRLYIAMKDAQAI